jgi:cytidylate kinase
MRVITISRLAGCGGAEIAGMVAQALGFRLVTKRTVEEIFRQYGFLDFDRFYEASHGFWDRFDEMQEQSVDLLGMVARSVAREGNVVILGRASFAFLQEFSDVLHVRLWAPCAVRVARVMEREGVTDHRDAERLVLQNDRVRSQLIHMCGRGHGEGPDRFDLAINTAKVPFERAAALIAEAARASSGAKPGGERLTTDIAEDPVLDRVTEKALEGA